MFLVRKACPESLELCSLLSGQVLRARGTQVRTCLVGYGSILPPGSTGPSVLLRVHCEMAVDCLQINHFASLNWSSSVAH